MGLVLVGLRDGRGAHIDATSTQAGGVQVRNERK